MSVASISWSTRERADGHVDVLERSEATGYYREYVVPRKAVESFVKARREFVARKMKEKGGIRLFMPDGEGNA